VSAIYGLVRLGGRPVAPAELAAMAEPMAYWGPDGGGAWCDAGVGLGTLVAHRTPEAVGEAGPVTVRGGTAVVTSAGRLDNRDELCAELDLGRDVADGAIVAAAYERWEEGAVRRLLGDWSFAAWHPREQRLVLARDHYGQTALYHHFDGTTFAYASSLKALLALPHVPQRLDELRLAQHLAAWPADGAATLYAGVERLPPAHVLVLERGSVRKREYWRPEEAPDVRLPSDEAYAERFVELFGAAVRTRLRSTGSVGSTLSAGLDSSAVTALAAREAPALTALTAVPAHPEVARALPDRLVDEWPLASLVAGRSGVEHVRVAARETAPLQAIARSHEIHEELMSGAPNLPWMIGLLETCRCRGLSVLLTGQAGNGGVSWPGEEGVAFRRLSAGDPLGALRAVIARHRSGVGWPLALRRELAGPARRRLEGEARRLRRRGGAGLVGRLVDPAFARRVGLEDRMRASGYDPSGARTTARERRLAVLLPGLSPTGALWNEAGAAHGLDVRDPTADVRLLEFCFGVPPDQFVRGDRDRWLMRRGLEGLVPPEVQWSRRRGLQGADIAFRLRVDAAAVDAAIARVEASPLARSYVNAGALRTAWDEIRRDPGAPGLTASATLTGGLNVTLFILRFEAVQCRA
jgi:asparagine synthase (glutamine-hydrolysing)